MSILIVVGSIYAASALRLEFEGRHFSMKRAYAGELPNQLYEAGMRTTLLLFAVLGALALLALVPKVRIPLLTYLGTGSLYIYLLHPLILKQLGPYDTTGWVDSRSKIVLYLLATVLLALLLGSKPVRLATRWLVQPRYNWPFKSSTL